MLVPVDASRSLNTLTGLIVWNDTGLSDGSVSVPVIGVADPRFGVVGATGTSEVGDSALVALEGKVPGIGKILQSLTRGWEGIPTWEKSLIIAAIAAAVLFVGWEAVLAIGSRLGVGVVLAGLKNLITGGSGGSSTPTVAGSGMVVGVVPPGFYPSWVANGTQFYRGPNGLLGVMNHRGRWKQWRPKKPIVIYPGGAGNLRTFIRAATSIHRQARNLKRIVEREAPSPRRVTPAQARRVLGSGD